MNAPNNRKMLVCISAFKLINPTQRSEKSPLPESACDNGITVRIISDWWSCSNFPIHPWGGAGDRPTLLGTEDLPLERCTGQTPINEFSQFVGGMLQIKHRGHPVLSQGWQDSVAIVTIQSCQKWTVQTRHFFVGCYLARMQTQLINGGETKGQNEKPRRS